MRGSRDISFGRAALKRIRESVCSCLRPSQALGKRLPTQWREGPAELRERVRGALLSQEGRRRGGDRVFGVPCLGSLSPHKQQKQPQCHRLPVWSTLLFHIHRIISFPQQCIWCRDHRCIYFTEEKTEAPKEQVSPWELLAEQVLKPRSSSHPVSSVSYCVEGDGIWTQEGRDRLSGPGWSGKASREK